MQLQMTLPEKTRTQKTRKRRTTAEVSWIEGWCREKTKVHPNDLVQVSIQFEGRHTCAEALRFPPNLVRVMIIDG